MMQLSVCLSLGWLQSGLVASALILFGLVSSSSVKAEESTKNFLSATPEIRAQLTPRQRAVLSAELDGKIKTLSFREGEAFKQGQTLVEFDCSEDMAWLRKAQAELKMEQKKHQAKQRMLDMKSIGILEVEISESTVDKAHAELSIRQARIKKCIIAAPFPGRVAELIVHAHEYVSNGKPLMKIVDDRNLEMELIVPSLWWKWLKRGVEFTVHIDETKQDYPAETLLLGAEINPVSQSFKVIGRIKKNFPELLPGMSGSVTFPSR
ncbi:MAG: efflux RND transporter periplasmic adaptor subunit [Magnetococcales bacterium]|nr:efflux RND transporter periplasmic adaptor subunit [Magnetococcales bacterium]MBF0116558.1 efflux RND transporter periplasmic adaptor subunit [Magnetococcales bacterium]